MESERDRFLDRRGRLIQWSAHGALSAINSGQCLLRPYRGKALHAIEFEIQEGMWRLMNRN